MKHLSLPACCIFIILLFVTASACVAPPKPSAQSPGSGASSPSSGVVTTAETAPMYVTIVTPYGTTVQRTTVPMQTTAPPEEWVEIYRTTEYFAYNKTAVSFNLKNPPMVINFSVVPVNVTGTRLVTKHKGTDIESEEEVKYDYYNPQSWFELTVRNKNGGQIVMQDGFGNSYGKQYPAELNRTIKVINRNDLLIEMAGNLITAHVELGVKKEGNIVNTTSFP